MNAIYNHAVKQKTQLQRDLITFENENLTAPISLQGAISATLVSFEKSITQLDQFLKTHANGNGEDDVKVEKFNNKLATLRADLHDFTTKFKELKANYNQSNARTQLFSSQSTANPFVEDSTMNKRIIHNDNDINDRSFSNRSQQQSALPLYNGLQKEQSIFERGNAQLDMILEMGYQSFDDIVHQNKILDSVQDRMSNSLRTLGVSDETIHNINKRVFTDKVIFYTLLFLLFLSMYLLLKYLR
ncbi:hypothetical protein NCAS_0J00230 [Naumovozyma castellii]|uniref:Protein transport protein BOS1 n=1 Tax=Naumovozyma castellii TaxID=27288 RepID=G0VKG9_NAUCA|nr:hypothetical protein NCAS_0J00230 [Naumovozyma castellii CBS 4309]CCC72003.1 hypothetical protein NCAS_0J00230 [Naumovozyma castellii CBS 4309]